MGYPLRCLGEVAEIIAGQSPPGSTYNEARYGLPFFQGKGDFGEVHPVARKWCSAPNKIAEAGDILISVRAPVGGTNTASEKCCIGRGLAALRGKSGILDSRYLLHAMRVVEPILVAKGSGSTFQAVGRKDIASLEIPLPPLEEQRHIADLLDEADRLQRLRKEANGKAQKILPALFLGMFGDPETNPMGWEIKPLKDVVTCLDSRRKPVKASDRALRKGDVPYYGANGQVDWIDEALFDEPLVLLAEDGGYWGVREKSSYAIVGRSWVNNHAHVLRPTTVTQRFLVEQLNHRDLREYLSGTTRGKLTKGDMNRITVMVPPRDSMRRFDSIANDSHLLASQQSDSGDKLSLIGATLRSHLFAEVV